MSFPQFPSRLVLALDFGGTKLSAALVSLEDHSRWLDLVRARSNPEASANLQTMQDLASRLLQGRRPLAIGVSFGGLVDFETGRVLHSHHVTGWDGIPLRDMLQQQWGVPAVVENDANIAALGEWRFGAGQDCDSLLYVTVSTGVGGGWVFGGRIWRGANGLAGEIGHTVVLPDGPLCTCGKRGCVESMASGPGMAQLARQRMELEPQSGGLLCGIAQGKIASVTAETISRAAEAGDPLAKEVLQTAAQTLGRGIGAACSLVNPQRVVIGGGVSKSGSFYWQALREMVQKLVLPGVATEIIPAALGDDAPLWGAVALVEETSVNPASRNK